MPERAGAIVRAVRPLVQRRLGEQAEVVVELELLTDALIHPPNGWTIRATGNTEDQLVSDAVCKTLQAIEKCQVNDRAVRRARYPLVRCPY